MKKTERLVLLGLAVLLMTAPASEAATLVVANKSEATVSLVDLPSGEVRATLPTGAGPHEVAVSPDGRWAVVTDYGTRDAPGSSLSVVDVAEAKSVKTIGLGEYGRPHGIVWMPDGREVLVTAEAKQAVVKVDVEAGKVVSVWSTGQEISHMIALAPDGKRAFVANIGSDSVTALDVEAGKTLKSVPTGEGAEGIAITPDGRQLWVTNRGADTLTLLDPATLEVKATVESPSFPIRAEVTPDGAHLLVSNARTGDLSVVDTAGKSVARRVKLDLDAAETEGRLFGDQFGDSSVPIGIEIEPGGERAYVAHTNADAISIVDLKTWKRIGTLKAGKEPDGMAYSPLEVASERETAPAASVEERSEGR